MSQVGLNMIVKNEERCIERCIRSVQSWVDEVVVVDTGSEDDTVNICKRLGAKVFEIAWPGNFSQARNIALDLSSSDWNLVLDADEWMVSAPDRAQIEETLRAKDAVGLIRIRSSFDDSGRIEYGESFIPRLLPGAVRYKGAIHEQPDHSLKHFVTNIHCHHDGYRAELAKKKSKRNLNLLSLEASKNPHEPYLQFQLGCQLEIEDEWELASQAYLDAIAMDGLSFSYGQELSVKAMHALSKVKKLDRAIEIGCDSIRRWPDSPDVHFGFGDLCLDMAINDTGKAMEKWLPAAESSWKRCLEIGDVPELSGRVIGRGSYLAAHNLAVIYQELGDQEKAAYYRHLSESARQKISNEWVKKP